jgi:Flp pilus assembly protein TadD
LNELGLVQRQRGQFEAAAGSYAAALALDPGFTPALRNLAILHDIYLDDPATALDLLEQYQTLTGEDRPVTSWIADVRQRAPRREDVPPMEQAEGG